MNTEDGNEDLLLTDALGVLVDWLPLLVLIGLVVLALRGVFARVYVGIDTPPADPRYPRRWRSLIIYVAGLVVGAAVGLGFVLEANWLWTIGLGLGLGASVVGVPLVEEWIERRRVRAQQVPRRPGHGEDV